MTSPVQRTLALLRSEGYRAEVVERRIPGMNVTRDLFTIIDILAVRPGQIAGIQVTTRAHQAARLKKAMATPALRDWLQAGGFFEVHGWAKAGPRGERKTWQVTRRAVALADLQLNERIT